MQTNNTSPGNWKKRFFTIWAGQAISILGSRLVGFAFVWYLTDQTGSATVLAIASLMSLLPDVIIAPIAGIVVDRFNRKVILILSDFGTALVTLLLAVLFALTDVQIWQIYLVMFLRSTFGVFQWSALFTSTSLMVPKSQLARVSGMNQTLAGALGILAPPLGAFLVGILSMTGILLVDVFTALLAIVPLFLFHIIQPRKDPEFEDKSTSVKTNFFQDLKEGFSYVLKLPGLLAIIIGAIFINLILSPAFSLLPILVTKYFNKGVLELGWVESAFSIGFVAGGLLLSIWGGFKNKLITSMTFLIFMGLMVSTVGFLSSQNFILVIIAISLVGVTNPLVNGPLMAVLQGRVDPDKQGRVLSIVQAGAAMATPIGLAIAGPLSDKIGVQIWFIVGGTICILIGLLSLFNHNIVKLGRIVPEENLNPSESIL